MRNQAAAVLIVLCTLMMGCDRRRVVTLEPVDVVPSMAAIGLGKTQQFRNRGTGWPTLWRVDAGPGHGIISPDGLYRAPYFPPESASVAIRATVGDREDRADVQLLDAPLDPADCFGPDQAALPADGEYVYVDELPVLITLAHPSYPDSARDAGVEGSVELKALVCASGLVASTRVTVSTPMLDGAAVTALRKWVFTPALRSGKPVAVWVATRFRFVLNGATVGIGESTLSWQGRPVSAAR